MIYRPKLCFFVAGSSMGDGLLAINSRAPYFFSLWPDSLGLFCIKVDSYRYCEYANASDMANV